MELPVPAKRAKGGQSEESRLPLSRERIIRAALDLIDKEGTAALTMRRLGTVLGVEAMSLYKHVKNKEDVIRGVVDLVYRDMEISTRDTDEWFGWFHQARKARRAQLMRHPNLIPYLLRYGAESAVVARSTERHLEHATAVGLSGENVHRFLHLLTLIEFGSVVLDRRSRRGMAFSDETPLLTQYDAYFRDCDGEVEFEFALDLVFRFFDSQRKQSETGSKKSRSKGAK
jgi:AcrR family transcriptional regulator